MSIQVRDLTHIYAEGLPYETVALDEVSFDIAGGEFIGIIGHTGSGKSTLAQHLNGLLKPKSGSIVIGGREITADKVLAREIRREVGLIFQYPEYQLFEETVHKDVAFGPLNLSIPKEEADERAREALRLVGLDYDEVAGRSPFELSGGQKRRVAIAGVLAMRPSILILDEPTAGLDPEAHDEILSLIRKAHEQRGGITILISHNMSDIAALSDRVFVMTEGRLILSGTPHEVFRQTELLAENGLAPVPAAAFMERLRQEGLPVRSDVLTTDEAADEIAKSNATFVSVGGVV